MSDLHAADSAFEEWRAKADLGEQSDPESVIRAHPDLADELRLRFEAVRMLDGEFAQRRTHRPPARVGAYRIVKELGRGGMGVVYEAVQESMGRPVALKVLFPSVAPAGHAVRRFRQEARIAGSLKHTNIVSVHDLGQEAGLWYCAMELVDGPPLSRVIEQIASHTGGARDERPRSGTPSTLTGEASGGGNHFRRVARMFAEVADALAVAHEAGVLHRDVKPSNLLLDRDGRLRLVDFGLARLEADGGHLTRTGDVVGTPLYMSPEHFRGRGVGPRSDVYSLGATLYEVLTLRPPHDPKDATRLAAEVVSSDPPRPRSVEPGVPRDLETVVLKALEKDPARRYATAGAFADDLRAFAAGDAIRARRAGPLARAIRGSRRHPARAIALGVALLGGAAATFLASWATTENDARRDAEYRLLLHRAVAFRPDDGDEGASQSEPLYEQAIALSPRGSDAYVARALTGGPPLSDRLRDVAAAAARGVPPGTAALLKAYLFDSFRRPAEAEEAVRAAGAAAKADEPLAHLVAGRRAQRAGNLRVAEREYDGALARLGRDSVLRHVLLTSRAEIHLWAEEHAKALDDVHALQALGDDRVKLAALEAWLWRRLGKESEASARAVALTDRVKDDERSTVVVGDTWMSKRAWDWLDRLTERAVERFPASPEVQRLRARCLDARSRWDAALTAWDRCVQAAPPSPRFEAWRAETLANAGRVEEALAVSERAALSAPDDPQVLVSRADVCRRAKRVEAGEAAAREALRLDPDCVQAGRLVAVFAMSAGRFDEAERILAEVMRVHPGDPAATSALAFLRYGQKRFPDALAAIDVAIEVEPDRADHHALRARVLEQLHRIDDAEKAFRRALELRPKDAQTLYALGSLYIDAGRAAPAVETYRALVEITPRDGHAWNELGNALREADDRPAALDAYRRALSIDADNLAYLGNEAGTLLDLGRPAEALVRFDRIVKANPNDATDRYNRALTYQALERYADAVSECREAARLDPHDARPRMKAATILFESGKIEEAIVETTAAQSAAPADGTVAHDLAVMYLRAKRLDLAEAAARSAVRLIPDDADSQSLLGHILMARNEPAAAIEFVEAARRLAPDVAHYYQDCAAAYYAVGREGSAADVLAEGSRRFPGIAALHYALAWVLVDAAEVAVREPLQAAIHARRATEIEPSKGRNWVVLGAALYRQERFSEALARLEEARRLDDPYSEPAGWYYFAMTLHRLGRADEARTAFRRAEEILAKDPNPGDSARESAEAAAVLGIAAPKPQSPASKPASGPRDAK